MASRLVLSGSVQARVQADLGFRVAGKVTARPIEVGDPVRAGQLLARIDGADMQLAEEAAEAALQAAVADASNARADFARYDRVGRNSPAFLPSEFDKRTAASATARSSSSRASPGTATSSVVGQEDVWMEPCCHHDHTSSVTYGMIGASRRSTADKVVTRAPCADAAPGPVPYARSFTVSR